LDTSVKDFEPHLALDGGKDGFELYRNLFRQIVEKNISPRFIIIELDDTHSEISLEEGRKYFPNHKITVEKDKYGYNRFLTIFK
jgi:release factor glutamine methyltransferase